MTDGNDMNRQLFNNGHSIAERRFELLYNDTWSIEDFIYATQWFGEYKQLELDESSTIAQVTELIKDMQKRNVISKKDLYETYLQDPKVVADLKRHFMLAYSKLSQQFDPLTRGGILAWKRPRGLNYYDLSPHFFLKWATFGNLQIILGRKGSGKTDFAGNEISLALQENKVMEGTSGWVPWQPLSNVRYFSDQLQLYSSFGELTWFMLDNKINGKHTLVVQDEMVAGGMRKKRAGTRKVMSSEEVDRLVRKFSVDEIKIYHYEQDITTEDTSAYNCVVNKMGGTDDHAGRKRASITYREGYDQNTRFVEGIPSSPLKFDTDWAAAYQGDDISYKEISDQMTKFQSSSDTAMDVFIQVRDWLGGKIGR